MEGKGKKDQGVVGSAELLDTEETLERLRELEAWGVDLTLVRASLNRTPTERIERMLGLLELADELQQGIKLTRASVYPSSSPSNSDTCTLYPPSTPCSRSPRAVVKPPGSAYAPADTQGNAAARNW